MITVQNSLKNILLDLKLNTELALDCREQDAAVFLRRKSHIFFGELSNNTSDAEHCTTWLESLNRALSLYLAQRPDFNLLDVLKQLTVIYFQERFNTSFWLVGEEFLSSIPVQPVLPIDCIQPRKYLFTKDGCICWHPSLQLPVNIDFMTYFQETIQCLNQCHTDPLLKSHTQIGIESLESILSLL